MEIRLGKPDGFSVEEAAVGISFSRSKFGFEADKNVLIQTADYVLKQIKENPQLKFKDVLKEALLGIRFQERPVYTGAISKMFTERSGIHRFNQKHHRAA